MFIVTLRFLVIVLAISIVVWQIQKWIKRSTIRDAYRDEAVEKKWETEAKIDASYVGPGATSKDVRKYKAREKQTEKINKEMSDAT